MERHLGTIQLEHFYAASRRAHANGGWWLVIDAAAASVAYATGSEYFKCLTLAFTFCAGFCFVKGFSISSAADHRLTQSLERQFKLKNVLLVGDDRFYASYDGKEVEGYLRKTPSGSKWIVIRTEE